MDLEELFLNLKALAEIPNTSGFEQEMAGALYEMMKPVSDRVEVDKMGNVYGVIEGAEDGPKMICPAHSDSVGFIVKHIEDNGYLRIANLGLIPPYLAYGQRLIIYSLKGPIYGVVGTKPGHIFFNLGGAEGMYHQDFKRMAPNYDDMFLDIGASSRSEVLGMGVRPGQAIGYDRDLKYLGDGSTHQYNDLPIVVAGGGRRVQGGLHINMPEGTPLANLWLTQAQVLGLHWDSFADSSGGIDAWVA